MAFDLPRVAKELPGLIGTEDQVHLLAGSERLIENGLVVRLSCPDATLHAEVEVVLKQSASSGTRADQNH